MLLKLTGVCTRIIIAGYCCCGFSVHVIFKYILIICVSDSQTFSATDPSSLAVFAHGAPRNYKNYYIICYTVSVAYIGGGGYLVGYSPPRNVLKKLKIILNVCYILMVLYAYVEFVSNVKSFWDIL
jgi:hypothetical protein